MMGTVAALLFPIGMIVAAAGDVMTRRIPNLLVATLAASFVPLACFAGFPGSMFLEHALVAMILLVAGYMLFSFGYIGAGDAKMMAVAGLWLGFAPSVLFLLFSALAGGLLAAAIGFWFMLHLEAGIRSQQANRLIGALTPDVPYGFALAVGAILATPSSWLSIVAAG